MPRHLKALVDDVLDMGRIDAGKLAFTRSRLEIQELLLEVDGIVGDYIAAKGLSYAREVEPGLPALTIDRARARFCSTCWSMPYASPRAARSGWRLRVVTAPFALPSLTAGVDWRRRTVPRLRALSHERRRWRGQVVRRQRPGSPDQQEICRDARRQDWGGERGRARQYVFGSRCRWPATEPGSIPRVAWLRNCGQRRARCWLPP